MAWESFRWASRWSLPRWLLFVRVLQVSGTLVTAAMNGFLLVYIDNNRLGFSETMFCLELMVCVAFIYSAIVLLVQHTGGRRRGSNATLTAAFVAGDVVFNGMMIAIITVLARTGLPTDCHGLTRTDVESGDAHNDPPEGYDTIRFGNEEHGEKGQLDRYCSLEQSFYFIAAALIFTYMLTVTLGILRIFEQHGMKEGRMYPHFDSVDNVYRLDHIGSKTFSPDPSRDLEHAMPSSEGVLAPTSRATPTLQIQGVRPSIEMHKERSWNQRAQTHPLPVSPVSAASPVSQVSPISPIAHQRGSFKASPGAPDASIGGLMIVHSTDSAAETALVTDGYRHLQPGMPSLPPYSPGQSRGQFMDGHGNESNEMRLSDYVKGETRSQNMKDSGMDV